MKALNVSVGWSAWRQNIPPRPIAHGPTSVDTPHWRAVISHRPKDGSTTLFQF
jgi:hypothetical protein